MTQESVLRPWEELKRIADSGDAEALEQYLESLSGGEVARALSRLPVDNQNEILTALTPEEAADVMIEIPDAQAADLMEHLPAENAAAILAEMPSDEQADLISAIEDENAEAILVEMTPEDAFGVRALASYAPDVVGGLMVTEFLKYPETALVRDVTSDLQAGVERYAEFDVQYAYVVTAEEKLVGVLRMRDLLFAADRKSVVDIMIREPIAFTDQTDLDELADFFERHHLIGVPVTDAQGRLVGVVKKHDVEEAIGERADNDYLKSQGIVGGDELRTMPLFTRSRRRLSWLSVNIVLNIIAASIIAMYQETLASVIALAVFLPIISDMSGCSGNQAVAVSIRELSLGLIKPYEYVRVWVKEILVGLINGAVLGVLIGAVAFLWKGNLVLSGVVAVALAVNTLVAVSIGGSVPLILKRYNVDPALASGPVLTTLTDMCGFFLVLSLATMLLPYLTG